MKTDLILKNGVIYTADNERTMAEALAVAEGKIVYIGDNVGVDQFITETTEIVDLQGKFVLPSFFEGHTHYTKATATVVGINLAGMNTESEYVEACRSFIAERPELKVLRGQGYLEACFPGAGPLKEALDKASTEIPIVVQAETLHSLWANSKAIELAGITEATPDPKNGRIERAADGTPSGCFRETAQDLILNALPDFSIEEYKEGILNFQKMAHQYGFTGAYDPWLMAGSNSIKALKELDAEGKLQMRFRGAYWADPNQDESQVAALVAARDNDNNGDLFKINAVKLFMDGVLESVTAYLLEPYTAAAGRQEGWCGDQIWNAENMNKVVAAIDKAGMGIHVHCAGDAAVKQTLDAIAYARQKNGVRDARHCITHIFLVDPQDVDRFKELGTVAMTNSYWAQIDETYFVNGSYIGWKRAEHTFPLNCFFKAGVKVANASDYPITAVPNPFVGIEIGVTRIAPDNYHPWIFNYDDPKFHQPLWPEECASLEDMIDSFTINQAYANFIDDISGSLEEGKFADLIVIDKNILQIIPEDIGTAKVEATYFMGKKVYAI
ncbi:amidohydrolase [uncultured Phascolarctobacterium sp.]|jgi:predicted amidohydrolase YtcJ|uniref:amidohydrolase n=1 Tax=uncultured Phascolarctobacterium sp. TaxID=512296 RepID=UPI0015AB2AE0|nr:amidohydrolase [uncultured Phascolarctobacterium sp.]